MPGDLQQRLSDAISAAPDAAASMQVAVDLLKTGVSHYS